MRGARVCRLSRCCNQLAAEHQTNRQTDRGLSFAAVYQAVRRGGGAGGSPLSRCCQVPELQTHTQRQRGRERSSSHVVCWLYTCPWVERCSVSCAGDKTGRPVPRLVSSGPPASYARAPSLARARAAQTDPPCHLERDLLTAGTIISCIRPRTRTRRHVPVPTGHAVPRLTSPQNSNRVEKLNCSIRQTNPCVLIAVHAPTMVGPTASSQVVR